MTESRFPNSYCINSGTYFIKDAKFAMKLSEYGEYVPYIQGDLEDIQLLDAMQNQECNEDVIASELYSKVRDIKYNPVIGYYKALYAGYVSEGDYRKNASSGGMGTWIFKELLEKGLIDGVIHVKSASDDDVLFKYAISRSVEEIQEGAKTKYYPAELSEILKIVKNIPGKYALIGIPSFIMEVRLLQKYNSIIKERIAFTIGLICGHQKTTKYAECLAWECGILPGNLKKIDFRKKIAGLPASEYFVELTGVVGNENVTFSRRHDQFFISNWGHGFFKSKFSDYTDDALNETADVSLGDAWLSGYVEDGRGNNIIITRNEIIHQIILNGMAEGKLQLDIISENDILRSQSGLIHHIRDELPYRLFKKDRKDEWRPKKRVVASKNIPLLKRWVQDVRELIRDKSAAKYQLAMKKNDFNYFRKSMILYVIVYKILYKVIRMQQNLVRVIGK